MAGRLRLIVIDHDPSLGAGVRRAARDLDVDVVAEAAEPAEGIRVARSLHPDVVVVDDSVDRGSGHPITAHGRRHRMSGLEAVSYIRHAVPEAMVVLRTSRVGLEQSAKNAGADLCLDRGQSPRTLLQEIHDRRTPAGANA